MKKIFSLLFTLLPINLWAQEDVVNISGIACEIFDSSQPMSSVRVRVTDKASYNAVSQIPSLIKLRQNLLEHDFNVIIYDLVDNHVQNMDVKTTSQDANELCVQVTGAIPVQDIVNIVANNSPADKKAEYDIKKENDILDDAADKGYAASQADVAYNGPEEFSKIPEPVSAPVVYQGSDKVADENIAEIKPKIENDEDTTSINALVYVAPVEYPNNTKSTKPISVLKDFFSDAEVYTIIDTPDGADYVITPKLLIAKIDPIDQQTKRLQMAVSVELKINNSDGSISEHLNRFRLFKAEENEQEVAMSLLKNLLKKAGEKLVQRVEHNENKWARGSFLRPKPMGDL